MVATSPESVLFPPSRSLLPGSSALALKTRPQLSITTFDESTRSTSDMTGLAVRTGVLSAAVLVVVAQTSVEPLVDRRYQYPSQIVSLEYFLHRHTVKIIDHSLDLDLARHTSRWVFPSPPIRTLPGILNLVSNSRIKYAFHILLIFVQHRRC